MFKKLWFDAVFGTIFILTFIWVLDNITSLKLFDVFDPVGAALDDVKLTDVVFSQIRSAEETDENIILVNIGELPRAGVSEILNIINKYDPKVVGIDTFFKRELDPVGDSLLEVALANTKNLVLVNKLIEYNPVTDRFDSLETSLPRFKQHAIPAFANLIAPNAVRQNDLKNTREFAVKEEVNGETYLAFALKLVEIYNADKAAKFIARDNDVEVINFRGNINHPSAGKFGTMFNVLDVSDVFMDEFDPALVKDKMVILCYLGAELGDTETLEDKYYSPMNQHYAGKSDPDMFGGVIHANIASMILNEDYIDVMGEYQSYILAIVLLFLNVLLFSIIYKAIPMWYDGTTKLLQLMEIVLLMFLSLKIFEATSFELDLTLTAIAVALAGDGLEVYFGVIKNLFTRPGRRELIKIRRL